MLLAVLLALFLPTFGEGAARAEEIVLKAGQILGSGHPVETALRRFGDLLKERSGGSLTLEIIESSAFDSERDLIEALQMGGLDLIVITTSPLYGFTNDFIKYDLPYVFPDAETARAVLDGPVGERSLKSSVQAGLVGLAYYENGLRHISSSRDPVRLPEDVKGLRIRTMESRVHMATFRALGATPVPLGYNDLLKHIRADLIDLQENPVSVMYSGKIYEVQKYYSFTGHFYLPAPVFVSYGAWRKLRPLERRLLAEAARETAAYQR